MLLPSSIQRSDDLVGMATPMVPLPSSAAPLSPPQAARPSISDIAAAVVSSFRTYVLHSRLGVGSIPHPAARWSASEALRPSVVGGLPSRLPGQGSSGAATLDEGR